MFYSPGTGFFPFGGGPADRSRSHHSHSRGDDSDEYDSEGNEDDIDDFFRFMFESVLRGKYSYGAGQAYQDRFKHQSHSYPSPSQSFFPRSTFSGSEPKSRERIQREHKKAKQEYEARLKEFEREVQEEAAKEKEEAAKKERSEKAIRDARNNAFAAARRGDGDELKRIVELFDLDVNLPRIPKATESKGYESLLHLVSASSRTTIPTIVWLTSQRNASPSALNSFGLSPFHVAVLKGNTDIVKWYVGLSPLDNGAKVKNKEGCHPGKAVGKDTSRTPLDLAMESGNVQVVELMVKFATVHKVTSIWEHLNLGDNQESEVRRVLLTKNGFVPPEEKKEDALSEKEQEKLEKLERIKIQEENRARKEERRRQAKLREEEEEETKKAIQLVAEKEKEDREREQRLKQMKMDQENRRKREEEEQRKKQAEKKRVEDEKRKRAEDEKKLEGEKTRAENEKIRVENEKKRLWKEEQDRIRRKEVEEDDRQKEEKRLRSENERLKAEAKQREESQRLEQDKIRKDLETKIRAEVEAEMNAKLQAKVLLFLSIHSLDLTHLYFPVCYPYSPSNQIHQWKHETSQDMQKLPKGTLQIQGPLSRSSYTSRARCRRGN
jgi:hypothetical protein